MIKSLDNFLPVLADLLLNVDRYNLFCIQSSKKDQLQIREILNKAGILDLNVGLEMAQSLNSIQETKYLNIESQELLQNLIESNSKMPTPLKLKTIAIYNLGILFEPLLGLDPTYILKELSKTTAIILLWEHKMNSKGMLFWDEKKPQIGFDFYDINIKEINIQHAI